MMQQWLSISRKMADNQYEVGQRFYEMKFRITSKAQSILQGHSDFINKIEANNLILPPPSPTPTPTL